jgi:HK97 family phage prohead protease
MREYRTAAAGNGFSFRSDDDGRHYFRARVVNYDTPDSYRTEFAPSVFNASLRTKLPSVADGHDWSKIIGKVTSYWDHPTGNEPDARGTAGLDMEARMSRFETNPDAARMYDHIRDGEISELSFAFTRSTEERSAVHEGITRITGVEEMPEISPVLVGAVPGTSFLDLRSARVNGAVAQGILARVRSGTLSPEAAISEIRATAVDPLSVLRDVDTAIGDLHSSLDAGDLEQARQYFQGAASKLSELQYLFGMTSSVTLGSEFYAKRYTAKPADDTAFNTRIDGLTRSQRRRR